MTTFALYWPVLGHGFILHCDDDDYVTANSYVQRGLAWSTVKWAFTAMFSSNWHPLTWLSHALDCQLFGLNPMGHHLDSVLIHALNAVILFLLLAWLTRRVEPSLLVAALFALHPLNVEAVAWVAERKTVLSTLFFFLTIAAYSWYTRNPNWRRYLLVAFLFAAGLMSKPMVITLPFVLLLLDYWPLGRTVGLSNPVAGVPQFKFFKLVLEKLPLLALSAASAWLTVKAQQPAIRTLDEYPIALRFENAIVAYVLYLWKMVWPAGLNVLYPHPTNLLPLWKVLLSALLLVSVTALVLIFRHKGYLPVGWFWFLGTLVPVIGLVQVGTAAMADRYGYPPLAGIFVMIAWSLDDFVRAKKTTAPWRITPALCVLLALGFVARRQMSYWESAYTLWSRAVAVTEQNPRAHTYLAGALINTDLGMTKRDLETFNAGRSPLGEAHWHQEEALGIYRELAQQDPHVYLPHVAMAYFNLGDVDRYRNQPDEARQHYESALEIYRPLAKQNSAEHMFLLANLLNNFGILDGMQNRREDQRRHYEEALRFDRQLALQNPSKYQPYLEVILYNLGNLDRRENRPDDARQHYEEALKIQSQLAELDSATYSPELAKTLYALGNLDGAQDRMDEARQHLESALRTYRQLTEQNSAAYESDLAATLTRLALVDRLQGHLSESRVNYTQALNIYRSLAQHDSARFAGDVAATEARLDELGKEKAPR